MSEIDDIFASCGKGKGKAPPAPVQSIASSSTGVPAKEKKKKTKKTAAEPIASSSSTPTPAIPVSKKRPAPETVVDPSIRITAAASAPPAKKPRVDKALKKSKGEAKSGDEDKFTDSRGSGPRKKTEEGWSVYKEDELGIKDEGGDTPLCPFDCECCF